MKIGVDIGGSHIAVGVIDNKGRVLEKAEKRLMSTEKKNITKAIEEIVIEYVKQFREKYTISEIGIAMPGWAENGIVRLSGKLHIKDWPMVEVLQKQINLPIRIENDAKCAGIAEHAYGCLKGYDRSVFLTLGTGIGGAVFLDNQLLRGGRKPGYEFGHMVIGKEGKACNCGRSGCFETYASMKILKDQLREVLNLDETTSGEELLEILRKNTEEKDAAIEQILEEYIENLSIGIQNLICIFEPEMIGIGGSFVYFEEILLGRLRDKIKEMNAEEIDRRKDIKIETAILGNDAGMIGAVL